MKCCIVICSSLMMHIRLMCIINELHITIQHFIDDAHQIDDATLLDDEDGIDKFFEAIGISPYWAGEPWTRVYLYTTPTTDIKSLKLSVQTEFPQNATFWVDGFQLEAVY